MGSKSVITSHPSKAFYTLSAIGFYTIQFPFWMLYSIPPSLRPNPRWTYAQTLGVRIVKSYLACITAIELKTTLSLRPGVEGDRFAVATPGSPDKYICAVAQDPEIQPQASGGTWYPARPGLGAAVGKVVLHCHGGAYIVGDGRTKDAGFAAKTLLANTPATHVFSLQYRLASNPGGRFPAALQDAITALLYLTDELGIPAEKVAICGDSAGGHLCLSLLRYIADNPEAKIVAPACAWLWSPWGNPGAVLGLEGAMKNHPNEPTDYLCERMGEWGAESLMPSEASGITMAHPNICILGNAFATPTSLLFLTGGSEILYDDNVKMYEEFKAVQGNRVGLEVTKDGVHDILLAGHWLRFVKEARLAARVAGEFWTANE